MIVWHVEGTKQVAVSANDTRTWSKPFNMSVLAETLEEVVLKVKTKHPTMTLTKIFKDRHLDDIIQ